MTIIEHSNKEIIGRDDINDVEAILAITNTDVNEIEHVVKNNCDSVFSWDYSKSRPALHKLYEKAKTGQWNGTDPEFIIDDSRYMMTVDRSSVDRPGEQPRIVSFVKVSN